MTEQEKQNEWERSYIALRLTNMLAECAAYAADFRIPEEDFVIGASDAYRNAKRILQSLTSELDEVKRPSQASEPDPG